MAKILITEDEDALRSFVARALRLDGHETHEAADGEQGLEKLQETSFDLLLSDIRMPVMDGSELAHRAAESFPAMRILLMTGYAEQRERADDLATKIVDVVSKPFALPDRAQRFKGRPSGRLFCWSAPWLSAVPYLRHSGLEPESSQPKSLG